MTADLTGRAFGRITIIGPAEEPLLPRVSGGWWTAECACGRRLTAPAEGFLSRRITSCGRPTTQDRIEFEERLASTHPPPRW